MTGAESLPAADDRPQSTAALFRALMRDPWILAGLAVVALTTVPYWAPVFSPVGLVLFGDFWSTLPLTLFTTVVLVARALTSRHPREMRFWRLWAIAFGLWALAMLGQAILPESLWEHMEVSLSLDAVYTAFYLCLAISLELHPWSPTEDVSRRLRAFEATGGLIMLFAALFYFVLIPLRLNPESLGYYGPSLLMYVVMDVYLALRLVALVGRARGQLQPTVYALLAAALGWCVLTDLYEYLSWNEFVPWVPGGTVFDLFWFPPCLLVLAAARLGSGKDAQVELITPIAEPRPTPVKAGLLVVYAGTFPLLHAVLYRLGLLDTATEGPRLLSAVLFMLLLAGLAVAYQRLLDGERSRLEAGRLLEAQNQGTARKMEALGRMAGGIAHDFNNLLTVISGSQEVAKQVAAPDGPEHEWLDEIRHAAERAHLLTRQLLAFSRQLPTRLETLSANATVLANERTIRTLLGTGIRFEFAAAGEPAWVEIDASQFQRVLLNLASNSRDAMPSGGEFRISSTTKSLTAAAAAKLNLEPGDYAVIEVRDTGAGLDESSGGRIFEPFFTTKSKGTGLGLATCFGIMRQFGGHIEGANSPGGGALFTLLLPVVEPPSASEGAEAATCSARPQTGTLLLAEDETAVRKLMSHMLAAHGYTILEARSGEEALEIAQNYDSKIDLLLTDIFMPGMTGLELALALVAQRPETRIAYCSGNPKARALAMAGPHALVPFLAKPFDRSTLSAFVDSALA